MKNKRVGIVTFHTALNYGAVLQTYALQNFLKEMGIENEIINYDCPFIKKCYSPFFIANKNIVNSLIRGIMFSKKIKKKRKNFKKFLNDNIELSKKYNNIEDMKVDANKYKYFISGSDQVWSPISANFDEFYFLPFASDNQKYSYAASIGSSKLSEEEKSILRNRLKGFSKISVREESAKGLLKDILKNIEINVNVDPTLLLEKKSWDTIVRENKKGKYLLIFNVEKPIFNVDFAKKIAKEKGLKIIYINDRTIIKDREIEYVEAPTPNEFITLFANADTIITNSFHGTVFSIIFEKNFYVEYNNKKNRNIRSESLLKMLEIGNREIIGVDNNNEFISINWEKVNSILKKEREKSKEYIREINS